MDNTDYQISLDQAVAQTHAWQDTFKDLPAAFRIDRHELEQMLASPDAHYIRAYLGINPVPTSGQPYPYTMVLVRVNESDEDLVDEGVYDFTRPCPPICAYGSPLKTKPKEMP